MGEAEQKDKEKADKAEKRVKAKEKAFKQNGNEKAEKALIAAEKKSKTAEHVFAAAQDELEKEEGNEEENTEKEEKQVCQVAKDQMKRVDLALVSLEKAKLMVEKSKVRLQRAKELAKLDPATKNLNTVKVVEGKLKSKGVTVNKSKAKLSSLKDKEKKTKERCTKSKKKVDEIKVKENNEKVRIAEEKNKSMLEKEKKDKAKEKAAKEKTAKKEAKAKSQANKAEEKSEKINEQLQKQMEKQKKAEAKVDANAMKSCPPSLIKEKEDKVAYMKKIVSRAAEWVDKAQCAVDKGTNLVQQSPTPDLIERLKLAEKQLIKAHGKKKKADVRKGKTSTDLKQTKDSCAKIKTMETAKLKAEASKQKAEEKQNKAEITAKEKKAKSMEDTSDHATKGLERANKAEESTNKKHQDATEKLAKVKNEYNDLAEANRAKSPLAQFEHVMKQVKRAKSNKQRIDGQVSKLESIVKDSQELVSQFPTSGNNEKLQQAKQALSSTKDKQKAAADKVEKYSQELAKAKALYDKMSAAEKQKEKYRAAEKLADDKDQEAQTKVEMSEKRVKTEDSRQNRERLEKARATEKFQEKAANDAAASLTATENTLKQLSEANVVDPKVMAAQKAAKASAAEKASAKMTLLANTIADQLIKAQTESAMSTTASNIAAVKSLEDKLAATKTKVEELHRKMIKYHQEAAVAKSRASLAEAVSREKAHKKTQQKEVQVTERAAEATTNRNGAVINAKESERKYKRLQNEKAHKLYVLAQKEENSSTREFNKAEAAELEVAKEVAESTDTVTKAIRKHAHDAETMVSERVTATDVAKKTAVKAKAELVEAQKEAATNPCPECLERVEKASVKEEAAKSDFEDQKVDLGKSKAHESFEKGRLTIQENIFTACGASNKAKLAAVAAERKFSVHQAILKRALEGCEKDNVDLEHNQRIVSMEFISAVDWSGKTCQAVAPWVSNEAKCSGLYQELLAFLRAHIKKMQTETKAVVGAENKKLEAQKKQLEVLQENSGKPCTKQGAKSCVEEAAQNQKRLVFAKADKEKQAVLLQVASDDYNEWRQVTVENRYEDVVAEASAAKLHATTATTNKKKNCPTRTNELDGKEKKWKQKMQKLVDQNDNKEKSIKAEERKSEEAKTKQEIKAKTEEQKYKDSQTEKSFKAFQEQTQKEEVADKQEKKEKEKAAKEAEKERQAKARTKQTPGTCAEQAKEAREKVNKLLTEEGVTRKASQKKYAAMVAAAEIVKENGTQENLQALKTAEVEYRKAKEVSADATLAVAKQRGVERCAKVKCAAQKEKTSDDVEAAVNKKMITLDKGMRKASMMQDTTEIAMKVSTKEADQKKYMAASAHYKGSKQKQKVVIEKLVTAKEDRVKAHTAIISAYGKQDFEYRIKEKTAKEHKVAADAASKETAQKRDAAQLAARLNPTSECSGKLLLTQKHHKEAEVKVTEAIAINKRRKSGEAIVKQQVKLSKLTWNYCNASEAYHQSYLMRLERVASQSAVFAEAKTKWEQKIQGFNERNGERASAASISNAGTAEKLCEEAVVWLRNAKRCKRSVENYKKFYAKQPTCKLSEIEDGLAHEMKRVTISLAAATKASGGCAAYIKKHKSVEESWKETILKREKGEKAASSKMEKQGK